MYFQNRRSATHRGIPVTVACWPPWYEWVFVGAGGFRSPISAATHPVGYHDVFAFLSGRCHHAASTGSTPQIATRLDCTAGLIFGIHLWGRHLQEDDESTRKSTITVPVEVTHIQIEEVTTNLVEPAEKRKIKVPEYFWQQGVKNSTLPRRHLHAVVHAYDALCKL